MGSELSSPASLSEAAKRVRFHLYSDYSDLTRRVEIIPGNPDSMKDTTYNRLYPLTLLVHGYNTSFEGSFLQGTKNALLREKVQTNVVMMDYRDLSRAGLFNFPEVVPYVPVLAQRLLDFLFFLMDSGFVNEPRTIHLIGESLGAQICGLAGKGMEKLKGSKIQRISGLDPVGAVFENEPEDDRLCPTDASFVDVVHSNQGMYGYTGPCGHVDFYLNGGGPIQPKYRDCHDSGWMGLDRDDLSHAFAVELFTESIQGKVFKGCGCHGGKGTCVEYDTSPESCSTVALFGYHSPSSTRGSFYVRAYDDKPRK